jgi:hypothetical protein
VGGVSVFRFGSVTSNYYYNYLHDAAAQSRRTLKALLLFTDKIFFSLSFKIHRPLLLLQAAAESSGAVFLNFFSLFDYHQLD